jgi:hypothetical protein
MLFVVFVLFIVAVPALASALSVDTDAKYAGYHSTLYTSLIKPLYTDVSAHYTAIYASRLLVGWENAGGYLEIARYSSAGDYFISPVRSNKNLILTTANTFSSQTGSVLIYPGVNDEPPGPPGNVILAHTGNGPQGKVGVGTTNPQALLDVAGNVRISNNGYLTSSGNVVIRLN